jgi:hypothetical protein
VFIILNITPPAPLVVPVFENKLPVDGNASLTEPITTVCPEHMLKSAPAFTVGGADTVVAVEEVAETAEQPPEV